ncbi:PfkB family carbohydrate kinase [Hymenobacter tibetensis]|uniref:PfkB family carbohydrate kinase n=1 Tax=Hymenobacter tibetensis TaxID=497967 RepID=A0ABY4CYM6_9BACT|nr:PfkB family carbohydrate kinase [Hymenobacter tibetensis]UOG75166.1 PfkB family carbohydrate kinase [Hymenobacter tibetensis]
MIESLPSLLEKLSEARVLVIGDVMLDHYVWGDIHRISPEAPVPVVNATRDTYTAGGAANVALNLANLGVQTSILGHYSPDEAGLRLQQILTQSGVELIRPRQFSEAPTIIKTRVIVRSQQLCRIDREASPERYCIDAAPDFELMLDAALANVDAVIISDYAKGVVTQSLVERLLQEAERRPDLLIALDPKPSRRLAFRGVGLLTPNLSEAFELAGLTEPRHTENYPLADICRHIHETYDPQLLILTLGARGMAICNEGKIIEHLPTVAREVYDVSGAGDTVIATLTAALAVNASPSQAARLANAAAGCVVSHMGTVPIVLDELTRWLTQAPEVEKLA